MPEERIVMQIFVRASKLLVVEVEPGDPVRRVAEAVEAAVGVPCHLQRLQHGSHSLEDSRLLSDYDLRPGATLQLHLRSSTHGTTQT